MVPTLLEWAKLLWGNAQVRIMLYTLGALVLSGIGRACVLREFKLEKVADFVFDKFVPHMVGYGAAVLIGKSTPQLAAIADAVWGLILASYVGGILGNLMLIFPDLPLPKFVSKADR